MSVRTNLALIIHHSFEVEQIEVETERGLSLKEELKEFRTCITIGRYSLKLYKSKCDHFYNRVMSDIANIVENNTASSVFIDQQKKLIK